MIEKQTSKPPKWASKLLEWYCRPELLEDLQGDLHEYFDRNLASKGPGRAKLNFVLDVFKFIRPYTIRKLEILNNLTTIVMFKNYFKTSLRSIARNKLFSAINIIGLAISMSVCLLAISFIAELDSYDRFQKDSDRIYRVKNTYQFLQEDPSGFASTSILAGKLIQEQVPGIEASVIMRRGFSGDARLGEKVVPVSAIQASDDFFKVFSFELLRGNPETALSEPHSIILTDETAEKMFQGQDPMGQTFQIGTDETPYQVTGIVKKPPHHSHLQFQSLVSLITYEEQRKETPDETYWISWSNMWSNYVYLKLEEGNSQEDIEARLMPINDKQNEQSDRVKINISLQPLLSIVGGEDLSNQIGMSMGSEATWIIVALTFIVILSAGFNYTNLSIARSLRRAKEVGIRKVVGATRGQVFTQFIIEATIISLIALVFAYLLFFIIKPEFLNLEPEIQQMLLLENSPKILVFFLLFAASVGFLAGFFPAAFLSKLRAVSVLKDASSTKLFSKVNMRKVLIVTQFTLSLIFIISASIEFKQYKYSLAFDLGFNTENVLNVRLQGNDMDQMANAFSTIPEVSQISKSAMITSVGSRYGENIKYEDPTDSTTLYYNIIDENYLPLMENRFLAGTNFESRPLQEEEESIIVNEQVLKRFNIGTPLEAIDKYVQIGRGDGVRKLRIIGVVEDFQYATIQDGIESFGFRYQPDRLEILNLKITSTDLMATMDKLEAAWDELDQVHSFEASFYDERIQRAYAEHSIIFTIVGFLAFLTISIAALGLLGMGVYTAETRLKEISIRKVLGASEGSLVSLLARGFMWLLVISAAIAVPASYFLFDSVILATAVNKASIGFIELFAGVIIIFAIGFVTIGTQTWKAAKSNPAQTLRSE
ncbi:MAG: FtsX-like permease family protein [Roseivirga sp.]|nr:FtsX-like permease family protein [Roseivirga sp.]